MNRGDVVFVDQPSSDLMGSKLRPAVVVQADYLNGLIDDAEAFRETDQARPLQASATLRGYVEVQTGNGGATDRGKTDDQPRRLLGGKWSSQRSTRGL